MIFNIFVIIVEYQQLLLDTKVVSAVVAEKPVRPKEIHLKIDPLALFYFRLFRVSVRKL